MPTKQISSLQVHQGNAANLPISYRRTSLVIVSYHQIMYVILMLHLDVTFVNLIKLVLTDLSLLFLSYSSSSPYSSLYCSFGYQHHCYSISGYSKTLACSELLIQGCSMVSSVFPFFPTSEVSSLAPCSISHHFQTLC